MLNVLFCLDQCAELLIQQKRIQTVMVICFKYLESTHFLTYTFLYALRQNHLKSILIAGGFTGLCILLPVGSYYDFTIKKNQN